MSQNSNYISHKQKLCFLYWLLLKGLSLSKFAKECGLSKAYLSLILSRKRPLTENAKKKIQDAGFKL